MFNKNFIKFFLGFAFILLISFVVILFAGNMKEGTKATVDNIESVGD
jgi:hypothetical protein